MAMIVGAIQGNTMDDFTDILDSFCARIATGVGDYLADDERVQRDLLRALQAFGAGILGDRPRVSQPHERVLFALGRKLRLHIRRLQADRALQAEQKRRVEAVQHLRTLRQLRKLSPADFQFWCKGYFEKRGFRNVIVPQLSKDFGVDLYMTCPDGKKAVGQCKHYKGCVGRPVVQQTYGVMHLLKAKRCYVITTGYFSKEARDLERQHKDIILLDGAALAADKARVAKPRLLVHKLSKGTLHA